MKNVIALFSILWGAGVLVGVVMDDVQFTFRAMVGAIALLAIFGGVCMWKQR